MDLLIKRWLLLVIIIWIDVSGTNGHYMFRLSDPYTGGPSYKRQCYQWYSENIRYQSSYNRISQHRFLCPCRLRDVILDSRWLPSLKGVTKTLSKAYCYDTEGKLIRTSPEAGGIVQSNPWLNRTRYTVKYSDPKDKCCHSANFCHLYYTVRSIGACNPKQRFRFGRFYGDPHVETLDGGHFTFSGYGEYVMLKIDTQSETFELQGRTELYINDNGIPTKLTVYSAFAGISKDGSTFQIELTETKQRMNIYGNDTDFTSNFYTDNTTFYYLLGEMTLSKEIDIPDKLVVAFSSGISLKFQTRQSTFAVSVSVPEDDFTNQTKGLLGNFDGNSSNDFILPNGTVLQGNETNTNRKIFFNFCQKWMVNSSTSIFKYPEGKSWIDYNHPEFVPIFVDEYSEEEIEEAKKVCGGDTMSQACIADYLAAINIENG